MKVQIARIAESGPFHRPLSENLGKHKRFHKYIKDIHAASYEENRTALKKIYGKGRISESEFPGRPEQTSGNCTLASHEVGYEIRLTQNLYKWIHSHEKAYSGANIPSAADR